MPRAHPPEFRRRAVELARSKEQPVSQIAVDLGISDSCLRGWLKQADIDEGRRSGGLATAERDELVKLRRELRVRRWRSRSGSVLQHISQPKMFSQNEIHLHR
jgi:transposase